MHDQRIVANTYTHTNPHKLIHTWIKQSDHTAANKISSKIQKRKTKKLINKMMNWTNDNNNNKKKFIGFGFDSFLYLLVTIDVCLFCVKLVFFLILFFFFSNFNLNLNNTPNKVNLCLKKRKKGSKNVSKKSIWI